MSWVRAPRWEFLFSILAGPRAYSINGRMRRAFLRLIPHNFYGSTHILRAVSAWVPR